MRIIISPAKKMAVDTDSFAVDLRQRLTPAVLSYKGIQYQYMAPGVMETSQLDHLRKHFQAWRVKL